MKVGFDPTAGLIVLPVRFHGPSGDVVARLALDTGATVSMLNWDVVIVLGYDPASVQERVQITTASGLEFVPKVIVDQAETMGIRVMPFAILCHTLPPSSTVDGLLGLDFFRGRRLILDFRAGTIETR